MAQTQTYQRYAPYHDDPLKYTYQQAQAFHRILDVKFKLLRPGMGLNDPEPESSDIDEMAARVLPRTDEERERYRLIYERSGFNTVKDIGEQYLFPTSPFYVLRLEEPLNHEYTRELIHDVEIVGPGDDVSIIVSGPSGDIRRKGFIGYVEDEIVTVHCESIRRGTDSPVNPNDRTLHVKITRDPNGDPVELQLLDPHPDYKIGSAVIGNIEEFSKL